MTLLYVTVVGNLGPAAAGAKGYWVPTGWLTAAADSRVIPPAPAPPFTIAADGSFTSGPLLAQDSPGVQPQGEAWTLSINGIDQVAPWSQDYSILHASGATQDLASLPVAVPSQTFTDYLLAASNLSDVDDAATALANLGGASTAAVTAAVGAETTRAEAAEGTLATAISAETTRAEAAEGTLGTAIAAETTRAEGAEATLAGGISTNAAAITAETSRAEAAEGALLPLAGGTVTGQFTLTASNYFDLDGFTGGNDDALMSAALTAVFAAGGGTIQLGARTFTFADQIVTSFQSRIVTVLRIIGGGAVANAIGGQAAAANNSGVTTCAMSYAGSGVARMDFRHIGLIEIAGILFTDSGGSPVPFIQTTNATPNIHDCAFAGSAIGNQCFQDAIVLGGTSSSGVSGDTAPFQGYQGDICRNYFTGIRRGVLFQVFANSVQVRNSTFTAQCGSNLPLGAAIELLGPNQASGNSVYGNLVEMPGYQVGVKCSWAPQNILGPNSFFDSGLKAVASYYLDVNSTNCVVTGGVGGSAPLVYDESLSATIINANRSGKPATGTMISGPLYANGYSVARNFQLGWMAENYFGDRVCLTSANEGAGKYPKIQLWAAQATSVADGSTTSGSNVITSATAAWATTDIGEYIHTTNIAINAIIQWIWTPSSPGAAWQASAAYATGAIVLPTAANGHLYQASAGGTTDITEPTWPLTGGTVTDGTVTWADLGASTAAVVRNAGDGSAVNATATATGQTVFFGRQSTASLLAGPSFQNGHIVGTGTTPAWTIGAAAGTGAAVTVTGTDTAQLVKITTGTSPATGTLATGAVGNAVTGSVGEFSAVTAANAGGAACITAGLHITTDNHGWTLTADAAAPASAACWFYILTTY